MSLKPKQQQQLDKAIELHTGGDLDAAAALYRSVLGESPAAVDALHYLGVLCLQTGRFEEAVGHLQKAVRNAPDYVDALANLGYGLNALGRYAEAVERLREALELQPGLSEARRCLADMLLKLGRVEESLTEIETAAAGSPSSPAMAVSFGNILRQAGKSEQALAQYETALQFDANNAELLFLLGAALQDLNRKDAALTAYRKAVTADPTAAKAWHGMSAVSKQAFTDADVATIRALQANAQLPVERRILAGFALGRFFEAQGASDKAAEHFLKANALTRTQMRYDIADDLAQFAALKESFDTDFFEKWQGAGLADTRPIFVIGMHRSGTTLVEQILSSHSRVHAAGEIALLTQSIYKSFPAARSGGYTSRLDSATAEKFTAAATAYLNGLPQADADFVVDKLPHNFLNVGMIQVLFPQATIIHCRRDARDTCFSIFKNMFGAFAYTFDLEELAHYYNAYLDLMQHWESVLPGRMHTVQYETLIADQEATTRALLDACGLEWQPACLEFHKQDRAIRTISATQAQEAIYSSSVNAWQPYEKMLAPLIRVLQE
jgi:tetratricopeptide (TPR) repeat protein